MSLINKMLQELDKRHAPPGGAGMERGQAASFGAKLRPVKTRKLSEVFWTILALCMLFSVAWVGWLVWQLAPRTVFTELAYAVPRSSAAPAPAVAAAPAPAEAPATPSATTVPSASPDAESPAAPSAAVPSAPPAASASELKLDMLQLATELRTPALDRDAASGGAQPRRPSSRPATTLRNTAEGREPAPSNVPVQDATPAKERAQALPGGPASAGRIDRRASATPRERADSEFRRAVNLVNQGRIAEGMEAFRAALQIDPAYETARQTLVALLLEAKRVDEAASVLQEGLALNPSNTTFAMLLARAMVERNDIAGGLALLQKYAPAAGTNAEYHGFMAALYQRLGRHRDAVQEYQIALQLTPAVGTWWIGLGISQQALDRPKDALDAYKRGKATGTLGPELSAYADQRLRALQ
jgi:MSHA biogenesis protein MshN